MMMRARPARGHAKSCPIASAAISTDEMAVEGRSTTSPAWVLQGGLPMARKISRRTMMAGTAAGVAAAAFNFPKPAIAQAAPFKLGLLTVKTGPLAQGGIQMEQGVVTFLKEKNYKFGDRKVDFISADTGGNPAGTKTKVQELVEREKVDTILGPLAAFELSGDLRLRARPQDADAQPRRRRGHHAAQAEPLLPAAVGDVVAGDASDGRLRRQGAQAQEGRHHLRGLRLRLRADGRLPADLRGRTAAGSSTSCGRRW